MRAWLEALCCTKRRDNGGAVRSATFTTDGRIPVRSSVCFSCSVAGGVIQLQLLAQVFCHRAQAAGQLAPPAFDRVVGHFFHGLTESLQSLGGFEREGLGSRMH